MSRYQGGIITKSPATPTGPNPLGTAPGVWRLNDVAYWLKQGVWPDASADAYWPYTTLLLSTTALGNANNNLFVDSSGAFNPISRNGNTTQGSFTPYGSFWSNYFDGSGDYLSVPYSSAFNMTGDFTIECWINCSNLPTSSGSGTQQYERIFSFGTYNAANSLGVEINSTSGSLRKFLAWYNGSSYDLSGSNAVSVGVWTHFALVRSGTVITLYINGTPTGLTITGASAAVNTSQAFYIASLQGYESDTNACFNGYISNFRVVKGTAVYTSNFTPPAAPLTAISGTSLLTCQSNRFIDNSSNAFSITVNGDTKVTNYSPFTLAAPGITYNQSDIQYWSGYFDGSGDYLDVPSNAAFSFGTGDFTIECWVYFTSYGSANQNIIDFRGSTGTGNNIALYLENVGGTGTKQLRVYDGSTDAAATTNNFPLNTWAHVAITRASNSFKFFVNGAQVGSTTTVTTNYSNTAGVYIGAYSGGVATFYGYASNIRVVKGTAVYTGNFTPPTAPLTAISGTSLLTCQNAAFTDNSTNNFAITINGNTTVTGNNPFQAGYYSGYFDGTGDYLTLPSNSALDVSSGDFTIEAWVYKASNGNYQSIYSNWNDPTSGGVLFCMNGLTPALLWRPYDIANALVTGPAVSANTWTHVAAVRSGNTFTVYTNGVAGTPATYSTNATAVSQYYVGAYAGGASGNFNGNISNLRVVKGTAVYTGAFTPPTTPLTAITNTQLLTCQSGRFIDASSNAFAITVNGDTKVQSYNPFYTSTIASNGGSMYLDGAGDYLTSPTNINYDFASGNFTMEGWFYFTNSTANALQTLYTNYTSFSSAGSIFWGKHTNNSGYMTVWFSNYSTGSPLLAETSYPPNNSWVHYALVRNGNTFTLYRNGVSTASASWSGAATSGANAIWIGAAGDAVNSYNFPGYINDFRITKGIAVYTSSFTPPTAPLTPSGNTTLLVNGMNAGAYDATAINDMETIGGAQVTTAVSKYGGSSVFFNGTNSILTTAKKVPCVSGTADFTIEYWLNPASIKLQTLVSMLTSVSSVNPHTYMDASGYVHYYTAGAQRIAGNIQLSANQWYHVAVSRASGVTKLFINGVQSGSSYSDTNSYVSPAYVNVGQYMSSDGTFYTGEWLSGYIDDLRITPGVARYTSNFTPPTQAFPVY